MELFFPPEKHQKLRFLHDRKKSGVLLFFLLLIPGTPKDLISYFAGLTPVSFPAFLLICSVARIPSVVTSTIGGNALGEQRYLFAAIVFGATLVLSLAGLILYECFSGRRSHSKPDSTTLQEDSNDALRS